MLKDTEKLSEQFLTLTDFMRCFEYDKVASEFCQKVGEEFEQNQKDQLGKTILQMM